MTNFTKDLAITLFNSDDEYPVDLDDAMEWWDCKTKDGKPTTKRQLVAKLKQTFEQNVDWTFSHFSAKVQMGRPTDKIFLTVGCFKEMGMMLSNGKGKEIRKYFLECEKVAKNKKPDALTELQILARAVAQMAEQEQRVLEQERRAFEQQKQLDQAETRLSAIEAEQGRLFSPSGSKYTVLGFAKKHGLEISLATSSEKGKKAASMCRELGVKIERINDPRFGHVGLYPESILIEVFK